MLRKKKTPHKISPVGNAKAHRFVFKISEIKEYFVYQKS